jgi:hypothetical protein
MARRQRGRLRREVIGKRGAGTSPNVRKRAGSACPGSGQPAPVVSEAGGARGRAVAGEAESPGGGRRWSTGPGRRWPMAACPASVLPTVRHCRVRDASLGRRYTCRWWWCVPCSSMASFRSTYRLGAAGEPWPLLRKWSRPRFEARAGEGRA